MKITEGIQWIGICTRNFEETVTFFTHAMGLKVVEQGLPQVDLQFAKYCVFDGGNGVMFEVLQPTDEIADRYTGPIVSFTVEDLDEARAEMPSDVKFITPILSDKAWRWIYFRAPDGNVYQLTQRQ